MAPNSASNAPPAVPIAWAPDSLPPFPAVALKALKVLAGTDSSLRQLCELVRTDPAFSAEILRVANSPLIAFPKEINSVMQASMLLGFRRLRSIVIAVGLRDYLKNSFADTMRACWRHSVACAIIAEKAAYWSPVDKDFAYTAGILHDIGRIALATMLPEPYARLLKSAAEQPQEFLRSERELFGIDHCQAGSALVQEWDLPEPFLDVTSCHHEPFTQVDGATSVVQLSCALANMLGFSVTRRDPDCSYDEILTHLPERARKYFPAQAEELARNIATEIDVIQWK